MKIKYILLISLFCLQACSNDTLKDAEIYQGSLQYLAFQKFASGTMEPDGDYQPLLPFRDKIEIETFIQLVQSKIGLESQENRKLAVFIGPIALDHSASSIKQLIDDSFDLAIEYDMPIGFHLDDGMFWAGREDLWKESENIEWQDWQGTLSESRYVNWVHSRLAPQMCFNCPKVRIAMQEFLEHIAQTIKLRLDELKQQNKAYLFAGLITGWETSLDEEFSTKKTLGYHALANRGFSELISQMISTLSGTILSMNLSNLWQV